MKKNEGKSGVGVPWLGRVKMDVKVNMDVRHLQIDGKGENGSRGEDGMGE